MAAGWWIFFLTWPSITQYGLAHQHVLDLTSLQMAGVILGPSEFLADQFDRESSIK